jgi:phytoene desaturase
MVDLVRDVFRAAGAEMEDHLHLRRLDPAYRAVFPDGSELRVRAGREAMQDEIREVAGPAEADGFVRFCSWLEQLYEVELPHFIDRNFDSVLDLVVPPGPGLRLLGLRAFGRLGSAVGRYFADERLRRIFSFQAMYAGLAPYEALAVYAVITYMDTVEGVYAPEGGIHALPVALAAAAEKAGVSFRYGADVERILLAEGSTGSVRGVRLGSGEVLRADAVVCSPDLPVAYRTLVPGLGAPRVVRRGHYSPSCVVWHAGVRGLPPNGAAHHNIHFGQAWDEAFRAVIHEGRRMPDPSILVTIPTLDDPEMAPAGASSLFVLEPVPNLDGHLDWTADRDRLRDDLARRVAALGYPADVEVEAFVDPADWDRQGMERGTPFALSHRFLQTGPFRPANVDRRAPGLVFAGSGTVPGVGIPMVLLSGRLAAERVTRLAAGGRR